MSRIVTIFLFCILELFGAKWKYQYQFNLKKDQILKIKISYRDKKVSLRDGIWSFRWTLYKTGALVTFSEYQKVKTQHVLYKDFRLHSFETELVPMGSSIKDRVYLLAVFEDFDKKKSIATMDIFIKDGNTKILVDILEPKDSKIKKGTNVK